jgi:hypothetical protein
MTTAAFFKDRGLFTVYSGPDGKTAPLQLEIWCDIWPKKEEEEYFLVPVILSPGGLELYGIMLQKDQQESTFHRAGSFRVGNTYFGSIRKGHFTGSNRGNGNDRGFEIFWKSCYAYGAANGNETYHGIFEYIGGYSRHEYTRGDKVIQHTITII